MTDYPFDLVRDKAPRDATDSREILRQRPFVHSQVGVQIIDIQIHDTGLQHIIDMLFQAERAVHRLQIKRLTQGFLPSVSHPPIRLVCGFSLIQAPMFLVYHAP